MSNEHQDPTLEHEQPQAAREERRDERSPAGWQRALGNNRLVQLRQTLRAGVVQARGALDGPDVHAAAAHGIGGAGAQLPHLEKIQQAFGHHEVGAVRAHVGGASAVAAQSMGAVAYASGDDVAFADAPDLHLAAHEAAHVVQQRAGVRLSDGVGNAGDEYERHADAVADLVVRGESAESLLNDYAHRGASGGSAVQRQLQPAAAAPQQTATDHGEGQCSEAPADNLDATLATTAMRATAEQRASQIGTQVPHDALDQVTQQLEALVAGRQVGSTRNAGANLGGDWGVSHQWSIRAQVQRRRVGVCGEQRLNNATIRGGSQATTSGGQQASDVDQQSSSTTGSLQGGGQASHAPGGSGGQASAQANASGTRGGEQTRTRGSTRGNEQARTQGVEGQGDAVLQEEEWEYTVSWTVETRVADTRPPNSGLTPGGGNDWSLNNTIARQFENTPWTHHDTTVIGTCRDTVEDTTPGPRPQARRAPRSRRPQRIE